MRENRHKLVRATEEFLHTDMDAAASFPPTKDKTSGESESLETAVERQGLDVKNTGEKHHNIPEKSDG